MAGENDDRVREWEDGLPSPAELTPLSLTIISPELASAFSIADQHPFRTMEDVNRASQSTFANLRREGSMSLAPFLATDEQAMNDVGDAESNDFLQNAHDMAVASAPCGGVTDSSDGATRNVTVEADLEPEEAESGPGQDNLNEEQRARTLKRPRLVWTPELHKRFVEAVAHLGIKNAVPKTIMQLMNVEGLTRENVASHLQKYRLYLKRMQGLSTEGPTASDQLFSSTPLPQNIAPSTGFLSGMPGHMEEAMPLPYGTPHVPVHVNMAPYAPYSYNAIPRVAPPFQRYMQGESAEGNNQNQPPSSSSHHILRLFRPGSQ